ncbi:LysR family transcriptional regulator [Actibacterium ureilyticum]|uniref:LysR family transcriptional regulator n=1 Tax=Actibacterium ureilyticum TaxID=1590614 RepID=UPI000BAAB42A|nr:LysR family transcriptional regulator [Actibacterium ureilyticum]
MDFDNWDEVRTAFQVARIGTVSGAADALGVHHATVIRHIDALESRLGVKLFQRHARGYTPTDAGLDLLQVAQATADQFEQLAGRLRGHGAAMTGELVVTTIDTLSPLVTPVVSAFQEEHPDLIIRLITDARVFRLEYGEAHVAIRAGNAPDEPDNVVQALYTQQSGLYAHRDYIAAHGMPDTEAKLAEHRFIGPTEETHRAKFYRWLFQNLPHQAITFRTSEIRTAMDALKAGAGIGFMPLWAVRDLPELVQVRPPIAEWDAELWLVTHVDLHRTAKVQAFTHTLKEAAKDWP